MPADPARLEAFLARLYVDSTARAEFLRDRTQAASAAGLSASETASVVALDAVALELVARCFAHKRRATQRRRVLRTRGAHPPGGAGETPGNSAVSGLPALLQHVHFATLRALGAGRSLLRWRTRDSTD